MKKLSRFMGIVTTVGLMTGVGLLMNACSNDAPLQSANSQSDLSVTLGRKNQSKGEDTLIGNDATVEQGSFTSRYNKKWDAYQGGKIVLSQGSQFELLYGALTPPEELYGQDVTIDMKVVQGSSNNELLFEFGPSGSQFDPPATVWFHYTGSDPQLFYIDNNGTYIEQEPDEIDTKNQWLMLKISHFSRYAVAWAH